MCPRPVYLQAPGSNPELGEGRAGRRNHSPRSTSGKKEASETPLRVRKGNRDPGKAESPCRLGTCVRSPQGRMEGTLGTTCTRRGKLAWDLGWGGGGTGRKKQRGQGSRPAKGPCYRGRPQWAPGP